MEIRIALRWVQILSVSNSITEHQLQEPCSNWVTHEEALHHEKLVWEHKDQETGCKWNHWRDVKKCHSADQVRSSFIKDTWPYTAPIMAYHCHFLLFGVFFNNFGHFLSDFRKTNAPWLRILLLTTIWHCEDYAPVFVFQNFYLIVPETSIIRPPMHKQKLINRIFALFVYLNLNLFSIIFGLISLILTQKRKYQFKGCDNDIWDKHNRESNELQNDHDSQWSEYITWDLESVRHF